jgi:hypothetical protein
MTTFNDPAKGDFIDFKDHIGDLMLFIVHEQMAEHMTVHGPNTAVICDIVILDGAKVGTIYERSPVYPKALKPQLLPYVGGGMVLGRLNQSAGKPGQNPAWTLAAATDDDKVVAQRYVDSYGNPAEKRAEKEAASTRPF